MDFSERKFGPVSSARPEPAEFDPRPNNLRTVDNSAKQDHLKKLLGECTSVKSALLNTLRSSSEDPPCNDHASVDPSILTCSVIYTALKTIRQHVAEFKLCSGDNVKVTAFINRIKLTDQLVRALEYRNRGQSENDLWLQHHFGCVTASVFGKIIKRVASMSSLAEQFLWKPSPPPSLPALKNGHKHENDAQIK